MALGAGHRSCGTLCAPPWPLALGKLGLGKLGLGKLGICAGPSVLPLFGVLPLMPHCFSLWRPPAFPVHEASHGEVAAFEVLVAIRPQVRLKHCFDSPC